MGTSNRMRTRPGSRRTKTLLLAAFVAAAAVFGSLMFQKYQARHRQPTAPPAVHKEQTHTVTLFFAGPDGTSFLREAREIDPCAGPEACMAAVLVELVNGPLGDLSATLPATTTLNGVTVQGDTAMVDFGPELISGLPGGSSAEGSAVYSVVNTLAVNFPQVKRVRILVDGKPVQTLTGHLDLSRPIEANGQPARQ